MEAPIQQEVFQAKYIPKQKPVKPEHLSGGINMRAIITSYPPLGQATVLSGQKIEFTVELETEGSRLESAWEVALWLSSAGSEWQEVKLERLALGAASTPITIQNVKKELFSSTKLHFGGSIDVFELTSFTIKFRAGPDQEWKWAKDNQGVQDGLLILSLSSSTATTEDLHELIGELDPSFDIHKVRSDTPDTSVWTVNAPVAAAAGEDSAFATLKFGRPWQGDFLSWFSLVRIWTPWLCPRHGKTRFELDKDGVMCSFLSKNGKHLVLLAISGVEDVLTTFGSDEKGDVTLQIRNDAAEKGKATVIVALGDQFETANAAAMYHARSVVRGYEMNTGEEKKEIEAAKEGVETQWVENWFDGLTYCTWNGLGQQLTEDKVLKAVDILAEHDISITNLIIDDNWQALDYRGHGQFQHGWSSFEADPKTFPNGLKSTITQIRSKHPNIKHIAVWHALWGYWGGLDPTGLLAKTYKTIKTMREDGNRRNLPLGGEVTLVAKEDVPRFYDDFYSFLSSCGVDAVKTDAQFMFDTLKYAKARADLFTTYLDAWTVSSLKHFSIKAISCMSQTPQILFHSQLPTNRPPILVRNSDDFFPEVPSSHPWHVWTNAHNSLMTQHLNLVPDWDMFQTVHDYSGFHAAARCVSGGPIYFTDVPGQHDIGLLNQMTGKTPLGKTVIFRPSVVGKSLDQYVDYNDEVLLKVGGYHGRAVTGTSIIGIFNTTPRPLTELLPLSRFPGLVEAQLYVVRSHSSGQITPPIQLVGSPNLITISLGVRGYDILSAYPLRGFQVKNSTIWISSLGLLGKMASAASVVDTDMTVDEKGRIELNTRVKALGKLGVYIGNLPDLTIEKHLLVIILGKIIPVHFVSKSAESEFVLEVDTAAAWQEMKLQPGWNNEVGVSVYISPA